MATTREASWAAGQEAGERIAPQHYCSVDWAQIKAASEFDFGEDEDISREQFNEAFGEGAAVTPIQRLWDSEYGEILGEIFNSIHKAEKAIRMSFQLDQIYANEMEPALEALQKVMRVTEP